MEVHLPKRCIVRRVENLAVRINPMNGREYNTFIAGGYRLVTGNHYAEGQLGVIIPAGAIVPDNILEEMWLKDKLSGAKRNKVKVKTMCGYISEGIFYGRTWMDDQGVIRKSLLWKDTWLEGDDVTTQLGITFGDNT